MVCPVESILPARIPRGVPVTGVDFLLDVGPGRGCLSREEEGHRRTPPGVTAPESTWVWPDGAADGGVTNAQWPQRGAVSFVSRNALPTD